jgi:hypothetical protein
VTGVLVVVYNPLLPIRLREKSLWIVANFVTIALFWVAARKSVQEEKPG